MVSNAPTEQKPHLLWVSLLVAQLADSMEEQQLSSIYVLPKTTSYNLDAVVLIHSFRISRGRLSGREFARTVGKTMFNFGGTFGTFMCIGSVLRCY